MKDKLLKYLGGQGWENSLEHGIFEVSIYPDVKVIINDKNGLSPLETRTFRKKSLAKTFYNSYNGQKAAWDITHVPELISSHTF